MRRYLRNIGISVFSLSMMFGNFITTTYAEEESNNETITINESSEVEEEKEIVYKNYTINYIDDEDEPIKEDVDLQIDETEKIYITNDGNINNLPDGYMLIGMAIDKENNVIDVTVKKAKVDYKTLYLTIQYKDYNSGKIIKDTSISELKEFKNINDIQTKTEVIDEALLKEVLESIPEGYTQEGIARTDLNYLSSTLYKTSVDDFSGYYKKEDKVYYPKAKLEIYLRKEKQNEYTYKIRYMSFDEEKQKNTCIETQKLEIPYETTQEELDELIKTEIANKASESFAVEDIYKVSKKFHAVEVKAANLGLQTDSKGTYFQETLSTKLIGWKDIKNKYYHFNEDGYAETGLSKIGEKTYYFNKDGQMQTGVKKIGNTKYLFGDDGALKSNSWYEKNNKWQYFDNEGKQVVDSWQKLSNDWYYFNHSGNMVTGEKTIENTKYYFDENGKLSNSWIKKDDKWLYYTKNGLVDSGWKKIGGSFYHFNNLGEMETNKWIDDKYYVKDDGKMATGWLKLFGDWYFFNSSGAKVTTSFSDSNFRYDFGFDGVYEGKTSLAPVVPQTNSYTVYITNYGGKYHNSWCSSLRKSKIAIDLNDAIARGYDPCARCH